MTYTAMQWLEHDQCGGSGLTVSAAYVSIAIFLAVAAVILLVSWIVGRWR